MERIALSIDLDYFNLAGTKAMDRILSKVIRCHAPIKLVDEHHFLVSFFKKHSNYDTLVNIDEHSDITLMEEIQRNGLSCANWVNFVPHKDRDYVWITPCRQKKSNWLGLNGCCSCDPYFWTKRRYGERVWKDVKYRRSLDIDWRNVTSIGIAMSYSDYYTERDILRHFLLNWYEKLKKSGMRLHKGAKESLEYYEWAYSLDIDD